MCGLMSKQAQFTLPQFFPFWQNFIFTLLHEKFLLKKYVRWNILGANVVK